jgi:hypothetical protein
MTVEPIELPPSAIEDLRVLLSLSDDELERVLTVFTNFAMDYQELSIEKLRKSLAAVLKKESEAIMPIIRSIIGISNICITSNDTKAFLDGIQSKFNQNQREILTTTIDELTKRGIINGIFKFYERLRIENFGLPHLSLISYMTDYRLLTDLNGRQEVIPVAIIDIILHNRLNYEDEGEEKIKTERMSFQTSIDNIDNMIKELESFKNRISKDIHLINDKLQ